MARKRRNEQASEWFHVMNRSIDRKHIFDNDTDRHYFVRYLREAAQLNGTGVVAYCLMGNHFHIVLRCPQGGLSATMQVLGSRFTRTHNSVRAVDGPIFRSRFVSKPILTDHQLVAATRYVHRNPLELGIEIFGYPWSSVAAFVDAGRSVPWVDAGFVTDLVGGRGAYRRLVEADLPSDRFSISDGVRCVVAGDNPLPSLVSLREGASQLPLPSMDRRDALLIVALDAGLATSAELAVDVGLASGAAVRSAASKARVRLGYDAALRSAVEQLRRSIRLAA